MSTIKIRALTFVHGHFFHFFLLCFSFSNFVFSISFNLLLLLLFLIILLHQIFTFFSYHNTYFGFFSTKLFETLLSKHFQFLLCASLDHDLNIYRPSLFLFPFQRAFIKNVLSLRLFNSSWLNSNLFTLFFLLLC